MAVKIFFFVDESGMCAVFCDQMAPQAQASRI